MWLFSSCYGGRNEERGADQHCREAGLESCPKYPPPLAKAQPGNVKIVVPLEGLKEGEPQKDVPVTEGASQGIDIAAHTFTFRELAAVTGNFTEDSLIGEGGFGCVYKGELEDGQLVAVKKLNRNGLQGNREFLVEVLMLSLLHHENLVNLIGYCADGEQRLLVYEFMPLGSLEDHLHELSEDTEPLDWPTRMKIAAGAARGLEYLHDTAKPPVIYRDLKSSNILLGDEFHPKLSDFGLAKLGPVGDKSHVSTRVMGTYGYCAPEYAMTGQLTMKSDIYSFGVVLLELITGRRAIDQSRPSGEHNLVAWARPLFKDRRKFALMADPNLQSNFPVRGLFQALAVAAMCLHEQAASRPAIADVVTALNFLASQTFPLQEAPTSRPAPPNSSNDQFVESTHPPQSESSGIGSAQKNNNDDDNDDDNTRERRPHTIWKAPMSSTEREKAVAEARIWGEAWREKRGASRSEKGGDDGKGLPSDHD